MLLRFDHFLRHKIFIASKFRVIIFGKHCGNTQRINYVLFNFSFLRSSFLIGFFFLHFLSFVCFSDYFSTIFLNPACMFKWIKTKCIAMKIGIQRSV